MKSDIRSQRAALTSRKAYNDGRRGGSTDEYRSGFPAFNSEYSIDLPFASLQSGMLPSSSAAQALQEKVTLVEYDPRWPEEFKKEKRLLRRRLPGAFVQIRHIGSTAVLGMIAKPTIDLLGGIDNWSNWPQLAQRLGTLGYAMDELDNAQYHDRKWLFKHAEGHRTHHLHLVLYGSVAWTRRLRFRQLLQERTDLQNTYMNLKRDLMARCESRADYTAGKSAFVSAVLDADELRCHAGGLLG